MAIAPRILGGVEMPPVGLGCMVLSHAYGNPLPAQAGKKVLERAVDVGYVHFDTAAMYGFGSNETLLGHVLRPYRDRIFLASKCGMTGVNGVRTVDGRPETIRATCEEALERLQADVIDLYYLHRIDPDVPLEDTVGAMSELIGAGKIKGIGLSEVSAKTTRCRITGATEPSRWEIAWRSSARVWPGTSSTGPVSPGRRRM